MKILITGSKGFVGRNLIAALKQKEKLTLYEYDLGSGANRLEEGLRQADVIFHLAGVNRPQTEEEFHQGNTGSTEEICRMLRALGRVPKFVLSSSIQAELDNPYGMSKRNAEDVLRRFAQDMGAECVVYRFKNLFGKWCRPNYNSVTATFCYNIANGLPIQISNPANEIELTHIDDVVDSFLSEISFGKSGFKFAQPLVSKSITLGELAQKIQSFRNLRDDLVLPDLSKKFDKALYSTYLSYLNNNEFSYSLDIKTDNRGNLAEFIKSPSMGQIFISRTNPGISRGDHYHHTKAEKFLVVEGDAVIRFRKIECDEILEYPVSGDKYQVVDIPPGYTHSIKNVGSGVLVTLFWASEPFDPERPDTYFEKV